MNRIGTIVLLYFTLVSSSFAESIRPEMVVRFEDGALACFDKENLRKAMIHGLKGEATKMRAMMMGYGGDCFMIPSSKHVRVISVEYEEGKEIGFLEIVGENKITANGAWAFSLGAEEVKAKSGTRKK